MLEQFNILTKTKYWLKGDSLCLEEETDWFIIDFGNCTTLSNRSSYIDMYGSLGNIRIKTGYVKGVDNVYHDMLDEQFSNLANYYIRDYTIEEFIMLFNCIAKSITRLIDKINYVMMNHNIDIVPSKRAL